jgi:nucleoside-diphosphate-sugar epimerase
MILVTGGTGFLGSHLLFHLVSSGEKVRALKRKSGDLKNIRNVFEYYKEGSSALVDLIEWVDSDLLDYISIVDCMKDIKYVYHSAALVSFNNHDRKKMMDANVRGTANIVNAALINNIEKLCFVSSIAAFGKHEDNLIIDEQTPRSPSQKRSVYSLSKYKAELEVWRGIAEGLEAVIVNPSVILGYYSWNYGSSNIFPVINKGLKFYTSGSTGFVDVRDVVKIMISLMHSNISGERFCISSENLSYRDIINQVSGCLDKKEPLFYLYPFFLRCYALSLSIISTFTGNTPQVSIESARSAYKNSAYSNEKIRKLLNYEFIPVKQTIAELAAIFLRLQ